VRSFSDHALVSPVVGALLLIASRHDILFALFFILPPTSTLSHSPLDITNGQQVYALSHRIPLCFIRHISPVIPCRRTNA
jgi:hypothetical protein